MNNRERIEAAISQWWPSSGGTARRIADVLEREDASERDARLVGHKLAAAATRLSVITERIIVEELEMAHAWGSTSGGPVTQSWSGERCVFNSDPCPECGDWDPIPVVHGPLVVANLASPQPPTLRSV